MIRPWCLGAAIALAAGAARGQSEEGALAPRRDPWTIKFEPAAWYVALNGKVRLPGEVSNGESFRVADLNLDSPRVSPFGELQIRRDDWRIAVKGMGFSSDDRGAVASEDGRIGDVEFSAGDTLESSFDLVTFAVDGEYAVHRADLGELSDGGRRVRSTVLVLGGIRALDVSVDTRVGSMGSSGSAGGDALHAHPFAGARWELDVHEQFTIDVAAAIGGLSTGDSESWSGDILVGFQWNPTPHLGAQVGYRQLLLGIEDGEAPSEFAWNGGLAGLYAGLTLRF